MARPSTLPSWATNGLRVVPNAGKLLSGWLVGERPAAQFFNWWQYLVGQWISQLASELDTVNQLPGNVGLLDTLNQWQRGQRIDFASSVDVEEPLIYTLATPAAYTNSANKWRSLMKARIQNDPSPRQHLILWAGRPDGDNRTFALTVNARWDGPAQRWEREDSTSYAHALLIDGGKLRFSTKIVGASNWTSWSTSDGTMEAAAYNYSAAKTRQVMVALAGAANSWIEGGGGDLLPSGSGYVTIPLRVPTSVTGLTFTIALYQSGTARSTYSLIERSLNFSTGAAGSAPAVASVQSDASAGSQVKTLGPYNSIDSTKDYFLRWDAGNTSDKIRGIRATLTETAPVNTL